MNSLSVDQLCEVMDIRFSPEQLDAITAPLESALIMAGAGSGKTSVMAARVVWLVANEGVLPAEVLGLTFTNKAAGEFRARVRSALGRLPLEQSADAATVSTYHAFAQQLLLDDGMRIGLEPELQLLSDVRRQQLAMRVVRDPGFPVLALSHSSKTIVAAVLSLDDRLAEEDVPLAALQEHDEQLLQRMQGLRQQRTGEQIMETARKRLELASLVARFRAAKAEAQCIDYADMGRLALQLLRTRPDVTARLRATHRVVLLDEYQDTSVAQRLLMQEAFGDGHAVNAVGDALQSIYEWRGANALNIIAFPQDFPARDVEGVEREARVFGLPKTQRFGSRIAAAANDITAELRAGLRHVQALEAQTDDRFGPGDIEVALHADEAAEFAWIAARLQEAGRTTQWRDMAVLLRQHRHAGAIHAALTEIGVPAQIVGTQALLTVPDIADVVAYLRVLADPAANPSWVRILSGPRYRLGIRDLARLGERAAELARVRRTPGWEGALADAAQGSDAVDLVALGEAVADPGTGDRLSMEALQRLAQVQREITALRRLSGLPVVELARAVVSRIGLDVEIEASPRAVAKGRRAVLEGFLELCAGFSSLDGTQSLAAFLRWIDDGDRLGSPAEIEYPVDRNAVSIMTVHSAKGLQRDVVVLPSLVEKVFPSDRSEYTWPTTADALPYSLLRVQPDPALLDYPSDQPRSVEAKAFREVVRPRKVMEETRLAYVAVTRAQRLLIATASRSYQGRPYEPSRFLLQLRAAVSQRGGVEHGWAEAVESTEQPPPRRATWPQSLDREYVEQVRAVAAAVLTHDSTSPSADTGADPDTLARWDAAIRHHLAERRASRQPARSVPLPRSLSTTEALALARDPEAFAMELVRPMPRPPAGAARRGSAFHAWVERRFGQQFLFDLEPTDDDDQELEVLRAAFERSEWARREPIGLEVPFVIGLGQLVLRGRMDAVYRDGASVIVVDWKTNRRGSSDPLQLAVYRRAAAAHYRVPIEDVRACFHYVAQERTEWHDDVDAEAVLRSVLEGGAEPLLDGPAGDGDA